jgi:hypothetical protein
MTVEIICPKCGYSKQLEEERIPQGVRRATCPRCGEGFAFSPELDRPRASRHGRILSPWENRAEIGLRQGILLTAKQVVFSPRVFFRTAMTEGGLREPLAFGILFSSIGLMAELFWHFAAGEGSLSSIPLDFMGDYGIGLVFWAATVLCPLAAALLICVASLVLHLLLTVVGGGKKGFEATFRAVCYSQATQFWALIPYVGGVVATLWLGVVQLIGIREIHGVSYTRVIIAFLIPVVLVVAVLLAAGVSLLFQD